MNLISLQIFPKGKNGWSSDLLMFGENITQLYGANGCGKTPLIKSILFCLGYKTKFRQDIYNHCSHAVLVVLTRDGKFQLKRFFDKEFDMEVTAPSGAKEKIFSEKDYTEYLFKVLGKRFSNLVTTKNKRTDPYLSSMLPIFYLDQDEGYREYYCPPGNFIKDQFSEMIRIIFDLPVKNSFDTKKAFIEAKERLALLDSKVESSRIKVEVAKNQIESIHGNLNDIDNELKQLEREREKLKHTDLTHDESITIYDKMIAARSTALRNINEELSDIKKRKDSIAQIIHEINTEIDTLNINEEARRVFLSFNEICDSPNCRLFAASSETYSKNLLYLKDQIKDLERNDLIDGNRYDQLQAQKQAEQTQLDTLVEERNNAAKENISSTIVDTISKIEKRIFELRVQKFDIERFNLIRGEYHSVIEAREKALDKYESFERSHATNPKILKLRSDLKQSFIKWLDLIGTINVDKDITYRDDFKPVLGQEMIKQLAGSTRIRAVLAYHAALIEQIVESEEDNFSFFILDTPKQHEIHVEDLDSYIKALKQLSLRTKIQIIFSTTEYHYEVDENDIEWLPSYPGPEQNMFLNMHNT